MVYFEAQLSETSENLGKSRTRQGVWVVRNDGPAGDVEPELSDVWCDACGRPMGEVWTDSDLEWALGVKVIE